MSALRPNPDNRSLLREYFLALVEELEDIATRLPATERDGALRHINGIRSEMGAA